MGGEVGEGGRSRKKWNHNQDIFCKKKTNNFQQEGKKKGKEKWGKDIEKTEGKQNIFFKIVHSQPHT